MVGAGLRKEKRPSLPGPPVRKRGLSSLLGPPPDRKKRGQKAHGQSAGGEVQGRRRKRCRQPRKRLVSSDCPSESWKPLCDRKSNSSPKKEAGWRGCSLETKPSSSNFTAAPVQKEIPFLPREQNVVARQGKEQYSTPYEGPGLFKQRPRSSYVGERRRKKKRTEGSLQTADRSKRRERCNK